jgi:hypothetical protein
MLKFFRQRPFEKKRGGEWGVNSFLSGVAPLVRFEIVGSGLRVASLVRFEIVGVGREGADCQ